MRCRKHCEAGRRERLSKISQQQLGAGCISMSARIANRVKPQGENTEILVDGSTDGYSCTHMDMKNACRKMHRNSFGEKLFRENMFETF